ncbi:MAG: DUF4465 domain-containing protein [Phaeodactylibacter sp.]|nr:DUF4465 domain-containing protein [Phaeodactylibacter sp.]
MIKSLHALGILLSTVSLLGQTPVTFEDLNLPLDAYYEGADLSGGFTSGDVFFPNFYDPGYQYWLGGWAYSTMRDTMTSGYTNQYSAKTGSGWMSDTYAIGQQGAKLHFLNPPQPLGLVYITNSTYAFNSIRDGDLFNLAYGGADGTEPDFFKLTIQAWYQGTLLPDSIEFYLADYRFEDHSQDYIVKDWTPVDLSPLGMADSLLFVLHSSEVGPYGINTPTYFCIDNFNEPVSSTASLDQAAEWLLAPNPANEQIVLHRKSGIESQPEVLLFDQLGREHPVNTIPAIDGLQIPIPHLPKGYYTLLLLDGDQVIQKKFLKQ